MMRMDTLVADLSTHQDRRRLQSQKLKAAFTRGFAALRAAREAEAAAIVAPYLARLSDAELANLGHSSEDIKLIRRRAAREPRLWY